MNPLLALSVALRKTLYFPLEEMNLWLGDTTVEFFFFIIIIICVCILVAKTIICTWLEKVGIFIFS